MRTIARATMAAGCCILVGLGAAGPAAAGSAVAWSNRTGVIVLPEKQEVSVTGFCVLGSGASPREPTAATLSWDEAGLQVAFDCVDKEIVATQEGVDNFKLWRDDSVYIWIDPGHFHSTGTNTVMVQVSAGNLVHDARNRNPKGNIEGLETDVSRTEVGWRARIRLPWKGLGADCPRPGEVWGLNLSRMNQPGGAGGEHSVWLSIPGGDPAESKRWGHVVFAAPDAAPDDKAFTVANGDIEKQHMALRRAEVIEDNGVLKSIPCGRDSLPLDGQLAGFPGGMFRDARDLTATLEPDAKVLRGTLRAGDVACQITERAMEDADGTVRLDIETNADGPLPSVGPDDPHGIVYALRIPVEQYVQGAFAAGDKRGEIPIVWSPDRYKLFGGKTGSLAITDVYGQTLNIEMDPAAEVTLQDSRKWSPNLHIHIVARPGMFAKDEKAKLTLRLRMTDVVGHGAVRKASIEDRWGRRGTEAGKPMRVSIPPWPSQYKLKPEDRDKLTAADVVGPDGVVYPNWTQVGVQGGIPDVPVAARLDDLGVKPETDISDVLSNVCNEVGARGGGAVLIGKGVFYLDKRIVIRQNGVVIRGSGRDATRLVFRYSVVNPSAKAPDDPGFFSFGVGAINFNGGWGGKAGTWKKTTLAADARRGDMTLELKPGSDVRVGDKFVICAWQFPEAARSMCSYEWCRMNAYEVQAIEGCKVTIRQPLRIDYPMNKTFLQPIHAVERCGVEDMTIEHTCKLGYHSVSSQFAWNCWVRRVKVVRTGRSGVHFVASKWCEVRDCEFDSSHDTGGGSAYGGFSKGWDCLVENVVWRNYRHAPVVQFGAQGNVFRNCVSDGSDAQWHAGWSAENLYENCVINSRKPFTDPPDERGGGYGYGMYTTGSSDKSHGPNGPRNVVYNCDVVSPWDGVWGRGASENWLFLHNRFVVGNGPGFAADGGFFDAIVRHNTFVLRDKNWPMLVLETPDCVGFEVIDNTLYGGNGRVVDGAVAPAVEKGNRALPAVTVDRDAPGFPSRPVADPPSIYEWQRKQAR